MESNNDKINIVYFIAHSVIFLRYDMFDRNKVISCILRIDLKL